MTNQIGDGVLEKFQQRVTERLQTDIGELVPEEVLQAMVQKAIQDTFFKPKRIPDPRARYTSDMIDGPSWFQEAVMNAAKPLVEAEAKRQVDERRADIEQAVKAFAEGHVFEMAIASSITSNLSGLVGGLMDIMNENVRKMRGY